MLRKARFFAIPTTLLLLAACSSNGDLKNPFEKERPFVASQVPADLAIVVDENHDTYYSRQHIQQVITANDSMSRTTYTTYRDYNNTVSNKFTQETPLSAVQLQDIWNDISQRNLLGKGHPFVSWMSDTDIYKRDAFTIQIRANGEAKTYQQKNGFSGPVRPLMLKLEALRLPITQDSQTHVVVPPSEVPVMPALPPTSAMPVETAPASAPAASEPVGGPATSGPAIELVPGTVPPATPSSTLPGMPTQGVDDLNVKSAEQTVPAPTSPKLNADLVKPAETLPGALPLVPPSEVPPTAVPGSMPPPDNITIKVDPATAPAK